MTYNLLTTNWLRACRLLCFLAISLTLNLYVVLDAAAQISHAQFTSGANAGNPNGLNTFADNANPPGLTVVHGYALDPANPNINSWSLPIELPFAFRFYGREVTKFCLSKNGLATFDTTVAHTNLPASLSASRFMSNSDLPNMSIAYGWHEFVTLGTNDDIRTFTFGTAPNRQFWVHNFSWAVPTTFGYYALVFEENTDRFYSVHQWYGNDVLMTIGIRGASPSQSDAVCAGCSPFSLYGTSTSSLADNMFFRYTPSCASIAGFYGLNTSGGSFVDFKHVTDVLNLCGISGHTTVEVGPGTYNEKVLLPLTINTAWNRRLTFVGTTTDPANHHITMPSEVSSLLNYSLRVDANYVTIRRLKISRPGIEANSRALEIGANTKVFLADSCHFEAAPTTSNLISKALTAYLGTSQVTDSIWFRNSSFLNGSMGYYEGSVSVCNDFRFENNLFQGFSSIGINVRAKNKLKISGNEFINSNTTFTRGILFGAGTHNSTHVFNNRFTAQQSSGTQRMIELNGANGSITGGIRIYNNLFNSVITGGSSNPILATNSSGFDIVHNTFYNGGSSISYYLHLNHASFGSPTIRVRNNFFRGLTSGLIIQVENANIISRIAEWDWNYYSMNSASSPTFLFNGSGYTFGPWRSNSGYDLNSQHFVSHNALVGPPDFEVTQASPIALTSDYFAPYDQDYVGASRLNPTGKTTPGFREFECTTPLSGPYTINTAGTGDFPTVLHAVDALYRCGVSGSVTFNLQNGIYDFTNPIDFSGPIPGLLASDSVVFKGASGNPDDVTLRRPAANGGSSNALINILANVSGIRFRDMQLERVGVVNSNQRVVVLTGGGISNIRIENCVLANQVFTGSADSSALIQAHNTTLSNFVVQSCKFFGGHTAIFMGLLGGANTGLIFANNEQRTSSRVYGVYTYNVRNFEISDNQWFGDQNGYTAIFVQFSDGDNHRIERNQIITPNSGIYIDDTYGMVGARGRVANNTVWVTNQFPSASAVGIRLSASRFWDVWHNSVHCDNQNNSASAFTLSGAGGNNTVDVRNNIFSAQGVNRNIFVDLGGINMIQTLDNNLYWHSNGGNFSGFWNATNYTTLPSFRTASSRELSGLTGDPSFLNIANGDLRINHWSSAAANAGVHIAQITDDLDGQPRANSATWQRREIGADERPCVAGGPLSGNYNFGPSFAIPHFRDAELELWDCGVAGPVVMRAESGTYNEQVNFRAYEGQSAANHVTVEAATQNATNVLMTVPSTVTNVKNYVVQFSSARHFKLRHLTLQRTGANTFANAINLTGVNDTLELMGVIMTTPLTTVSQQLVVAIAPTTRLRGFNVQECTFQGGGRSLNLLGNNAVPFENVVVQANSFIGFGERAVNVIWAPGIKILGNSFLSSLSTSEGILLHQSNNDVEIANNQINVRFRGIRYAQSVNTIDSPARIHHNRVITGSGAGSPSAALGLENVDYTDVVFNSMVVNTTSCSNCPILDLQGTTGPPTLRFLNNALASNDGIVYFRIGASAIDRIQQLDYNYFHQPNVGSRSHQVGSTFYNSLDDFTVVTTYNNLRYEMNSYAGAMPFFSLTDLRAPNNSPLRSLGVSVPGYGEDYEGQVRPDFENAAGITIGADQVPCQIAPFTPFSGTYTVGASGDFLNPRDAILHLNECGVAGSVTFRVQAGTYTGSVRTGRLMGQGANDSIKLVGNTASPNSYVWSEPAVANFGGTNYRHARNYLLRLDGTRHWVIDGLSLRRTLNQANSAVLSLWADNQNLTIRGSAFVTASTSAINSNVAITDIDGGDDNLLLENSTFNSFGFVTRSRPVSGTGGCLQNNWTIRDNTLNEGGRSVGFDFQHARNLTVKGNTMFHSTNASSAGIVVDSVTQNLLIANNDIRYRFHHIQFFTVDPGVGFQAVIENNVLAQSGVSNSNFVFMINVISSASRLLIRNNSFNSNTNVTGAAGIRLQNQTGNSLVQVYNNSISGTHMGPVRIESAASLSAISSLRNNLYHSQNSGIVGHYNGNDYNDYSSWSSATGSLDVQSIVDNPLYTSTSDLRPQPGSPLGNAGWINNAPTLDIDSNIRNLAKPDIGAYEFENWDITVVSFISPEIIAGGFCGGTQPITLRLRNSGQNPFDKAIINLKLGSLDLGNFSYQGAQINPDQEFDFYLTDLYFQPGQTYSLSVAVVDVGANPDGNPANDNVTINGNVAPEIELISASVKYPICGTSDLGSIELEATHPSGIASYQWQHGPSDPDVFDLAEDLYQVTITANSGCQLIQEFILTSSGIVYVTEGGCTSGGDCGSITNPADLQWAWNRTFGYRPNARAWMRIGEGNYAPTSPLPIRDHVVYEGGYDPIKWNKSSLGALATNISYQGIALRDGAGREHVVPINGAGRQHWALHDLTISSRNAQGVAGSSYGVRCVECSNYTIARCQIKAGKGSNGANGSAGSSGSVGTPGFSFVSPNTLGGIGGLNFGAGGNGGNGGTTTTNHTNGSNGNLGATGGPRGIQSGSSYTGCLSVPTSHRGLDGNNGGNGAPGGNGTAGTAPTYSNFFTPGGQGNIGFQGTPGGGGGGGGGGAGFNMILFGFRNGGAGGGGGGGGQGGFGGSGGTGGGASIAVYLHNNGANAFIVDCNLESTGAGAGGVGGSGGFGGSGGSGGFGAEGDGPCANTSGGKGGNGGAGGSGGKGGDGQPGVSRALYFNSIEPDVRVQAVDQRTNCASNANCGSVAKAYPFELDFQTERCSYSYQKYTSTAPPVPAQWTLPGGEPVNSSKPADSVYYDATGVYSITVSSPTNETYALFVQVPTERDLHQLNMTQDNSPVTSLCGIDSVNISHTGPGGRFDGANILAYKWVIPGGSADEIGSPLSAATLSSPDPGPVWFLTPGTYDISLQTLHDCCGWSVPVTQTLVVYEAPQIDAYTLTDSYCNSINFGEIEINAIGGQSPYEYSIDGGSAWQASSVFVDLWAGNYSLVVRDANGCTSQAQDVILSEPPILEVDSWTALDPLCNGSPTGEITFAGIGGVSPYEYSLDGSSYQSSGTFTDLLVGSYTLYVRDANGCVATLSDVILTDPPALSISNVSTTDNTCFQSLDGEIDITASGGTGTLLYSIDGFNFQMSGTFTGLSAGSYTVYVQDENGCEKVDGVNLTEPLELVFDNIGTINPTCVSAANGQINLLGDGGTPPYLYSLDGSNFQVSGTFIGLTASDYTVYIQDANGCTNFAGDIYLFDPAPVVIVDIVPQNPSCAGGSNGQLLINATGGTGTLYYSLDNNSYQTNNLFTGLPAGSYTVYVMDDNTCQTTDNTSLTEPSQLFVDSWVVNDPICAGLEGSIEFGGVGGVGPYEYSIDGSFYQGSGTFTNLIPDQFTLYVRDANGCVATEDVEMFEPLEVVINSITPVSPSCFGGTNGELSISASGGTGTYFYSLDGFSFQGMNVFTGLSAGSYTVYVQDENGCEKVEGVNLTEPNQLIINSVTSANVTCFGGSDAELTITASGGSGDLEYSLDGFIYQTNPMFQFLVAGNYTAYVRDLNGCVVNQSGIILTQPSSAVGATFVVTDESFPGANDGVIDATPSGGTPGYTIDWYTHPGAVYQGSGFSIGGLEAGEYRADVTDANGCLFQDFITVEVDDFVAVRLRAMLQGPYKSSLGQMKDSLNNAPNTVLADFFEFGGPGDPTGFIPAGETMRDGFSIPSNAIDVVIIELRTGTAASTILDSIPMWLLADGSMVDFRTGLVDEVRAYGRPADDYYVVVRHRNHLPVMSASPVSFDFVAAATPYDFTSLANIFGEGAYVQDGKAMLYAADAVRNPMFDSGQVNALDFFRVFMDTQVPESNEYHNSDVNLDGFLNAADYDLVSRANDNLYESTVPE